MPAHIARGNTTRSLMRSCIAHVFAEQKHRMALSIRTIGIERAKAKIALANLAYNMKRFVFLEKKRTIGLYPSKGRKTIKKRVKFSKKHQKNANRHTYQLKNPLILKISPNQSGS